MNSPPIKYLTLENSQPGHARPPSAFKGRPPSAARPSKPPSAKPTASPSPSPSPPTSPILPSSVLAVVGTSTGRGVTNSLIPPPPPEIAAAKIQTAFRRHSILSSISIIPQDDPVTALPIPLGKLFKLPCCRQYIHKDNLLDWAKKNSLESHTINPNTAQPFAQLHLCPLCRQNEPLAEYFAKKHISLEPDPILQNFDRYKNQLLPIEELRRKQLVDIATVPLAALADPRRKAALHAYLRQNTPVFTPEQRNEIFTGVRQQEKLVHNINAKNAEGLALIHLAVINYGPYTPANLDALLAQRADINLPGDTRLGFTPLHFAIDSGRIPLVRHLLAKGARTEIRSFEGHTPLCLAISKQNTPIFNLLLDYKASISNPCANGHTPLTTAVFCHNYPILDLLLKRIKQKPFPDKSKILNAATEEGKRALHYAVCNKHLDIVIRLLGEAGIDINATDNDGNTALHLAVMIKDENIIEALMRKKARIDISNKEEKTPLSLSLDSPRINQILQDPRFQ